MIALYGVTPLPFETPSAASGQRWCGTSHTQKQPGRAGRTGCMVTV